MASRWDERDGRRVAPSVNGYGQPSIPPPNVPMHSHIPMPPYAHYPGMHQNAMRPPMGPPASFPSRPPPGAMPFGQPLAYPPYPQVPIQGNAAFPGARPPFFPPSMPPPAIPAPPNSVKAPAAPVPNKKTPSSAPTRTYVSQKVPKESQKGTEFLCKPKYRNTLPTPPIQTKLWQYEPPFLSNLHDRFVSYRLTDLEQHYAFPIGLDPRDCVPLDLVDYAKWQPREGDVLSKEDAQLLAFDLAQTSQPADKTVARAAPSGQAKVARAAHRPEVTWLRRTEYISSEFKSSTRSAQREQTQAPWQALESREAQIQSIEESFDWAERTLAHSLEHPSRPGVRAVEVLPVFPNFDTWGTAYATVVFNLDPTLDLHVLHGESLTQRSPEAIRNLRSRQTEHALFKGASTEDNDVFFLYYLPKDRTLAKRATGPPAQDAEDHVKEAYTNEVEEYLLAREYDYAQAKNEKSEHRFFFHLRRGVAAYYNPIDVQTSLRKRRGKSKMHNAAGEDPSPYYEKPTLLNVTRRDYNEAELARREERISELIGEEEAVIEEEVVAS